MWRPPSLLKEVRTLGISKTPRQLSKKQIVELSNYQVRLAEMLSLWPELAKSLREAERRKGPYLSHSSRLAMHSDLCGYLAFLRAKGASSCPPLPIEPAQLVSYFERLFSDGRSARSIDRYVSSMVNWSKFLGFTSPRAEPGIAAFLERAKAGSKIPDKTPKVGISARDITDAIKLFDKLERRDAQDLALLLTAFESLARRSELSGLNWEDLHPLPAGKTLLRLRRASGKTDWISLSKLTTEHLDHWRKVCGEQAGPLFRGVRKGGACLGRLSQKGITRAFKRIARRIGHDEDCFSAHSIRVGAAQHLMMAEVPISEIMLAGDWRSPNTLMKYGVSRESRCSLSLSTLLGTGLQRNAS